MDILCQAKFKFPGSQKICVSKETLTGIIRFEAEQWLVLDGSGVIYVLNHWTLNKSQELHC